MLNNIKDLYQLQAKAREIQKKLAEEIVESEQEGIKITMNGKQEVLSVVINSELSKDNQEKYLRDVFNNCIKKVQQLMAKNMMM